MQIDPASFFILVATFGAGGVGGYIASEKHVFFPPPPPPPKEAPPPPPPVASTPPPPPPPAPKPVCEDMTGSPGTCPPPGWPAEEGGCGALPTHRCEDYKKAFRPHVAERAVACINALTPAQRCDPKRLELCGHSALMTSCSIDDLPDVADAGADEVTAHCTAILRGCAGVMPGTTMRDCRATLAGMSVLGRDRMVACMTTHCTDKGLLYCEANIDVK